MSTDAPLSTINLTEHTYDLLARRQIVTLRELLGVVHDRSILGFEGMSPEAVTEIEGALDEALREGVQTHGYGSSCLANFLTAAPPKIVKQIRSAMDRRPDFNPDNEDELREMLAEVGLSLGELDRRTGQVPA